jgi:hypothetical protein
VAVGRQFYLTNGCYACHGLEAQLSQIFAHARLKAPLRHFTEFQAEAAQAQFPVVCRAAVCGPSAALESPASSPILHALPGTNPCG